GTGPARAFSGDDGPATAAQLYYPEGLALDSAGNLFIADVFNHRVRRVDAQTRVITTYAGNGALGFTGDNGPATAAQLYYPRRLALDSAGNLFIADSGNRVRRVDGRNRIINTYAGSGTLGLSGDNGPAIAAQLCYPEGLALDSAGNLFIADSVSRVRRVDAQTRVIYTYAGNGTSGFSGDNGPASAAQLAGPSGLAIDSAGNL